MLLRRAAYAVLPLLLVACTSGGGPSPTPSKTSPDPLPTLPAGELAHRVLQPGDMQRGLFPIAAQTGPAGVQKIASFSGDPVGAERALRAHGFRAAYVVQYASPTNTGVVTNVVVEFTTADGARRDLDADLAATRTTGTPVEVPGLGDGGRGVRTHLDPKAKTGDLVTLRWRVGALTFLLAVGSQAEVDQAAVRRLADLLTARARGEQPTQSPQPTGTPS